MNIAFISSAFMREKKESTSITLILLAREFIGRGHRTVIITEAKGGHPTFEHIDGVPIYRVFSGKIIAHGRTLKDVQKKLGLKFDVIHGFSAAPFLVLRTFLARRLFSHKAKTIHTIKSYSKYSHHFARLLNRVDHVTVSTDVMKVKLLGKKVKKVDVVRSFIDTQKFKPAANKVQLKWSAGYRKHRVLFYYGSLYEKKGVTYLIRALKEVLREFPHVVLLLAPRHKITEDYTRLIDSLGLGDEIKIITDDIDVVMYVNLADVVVLPYVDMIGTEGNPSCLLEAVACRTPVVTTNQPELKEIFTSEEITYATPADPHALAESICGVLRDKEQTKQKTENAYMKIADFDVRKVADEFLALYKQ